MLFRKRKVEKEPSVSIYFVCDAGMGSSALGASLLQRRINEHNLLLRIRNTSVDEIPDQIDVIIAHHNYANRIRKEHPTARLYEISNFMDVSQYERIVEDLMEYTKQKKEILEVKNIKLNCTASTSEEAIRYAGELLVEAGYVKERYIDGMLRRNASLTTYIGNDIAIPHGEYDVKDEVIRTGIVVMIYPDGIDWDGNPVRIVIGIGACNDDHMSVLANIATKLGDMEEVERVVASKDSKFIYDLLTSEEGV